MSQNSDKAEEIWKFNKIVSLGSSCPMSANIERTYGRKTMSPFDWWWTPFTGLISVLLDNDPNLITENRLLTASELWGQFEVFNHKYRIHFNHHFDADRNAEKGLRPDWRQEPLANFSAHVNRVWEYFTSLNDEENRILFFRSVHTLDIQRAQDGVGTGTCFEDVILLETILKAMFNKSSVRLVMVDYLDLQARLQDLTDPELKDGLKDVRFIAPRHDSQPDWRGSPERWEAALRSLPYQYESD